MGLFTKRTEDSSASGLYTIGAQKTALIVGLGNTGKEYNGTRHNIGFEIVDAFATQQDFPDWIDKKDLKCKLTRKTIGGVDVLLVKPTTYMNESGQAVQAVQHFYKVTNSQTLVVHDELDIAFGQIRTRVGGSDAGNNGIKSVSQHCGEDYARLRIGIANDISAKAEGANFVLGRFNGAEHDHMPLLLREATSIIHEYLASNQLPHDTRNFLI
jgi:peptidyl-tRNA hydrolase, PTH1 family